MQTLWYYLWISVVGTAAVITFLVFFTICIAIICAIFAELFCTKRAPAKVAAPQTYPDLQHGHDVLDDALANLDTNLKVIEAENRGFKIYRG